MLRRLALPVSCAVFVLAAVANASGAPAASPASAAQGKRLFLRCASCHAVGGTGGGKIGPNLMNVVGRKAGSLPGYAYSPAMKAATFAWDEAALDRWLTKPSAVVPGTSMAFAGLPKPADREAIIAYLKSPGK